MDARKPSERSTELLAAQERLLQLRASLPDKPANQIPAGRSSQAEAPDLTQLGQVLLNERRQREAELQGSQASDTLKAALTPTKPPTTINTPPSSDPAAPETDQNIRRTVKVYPSLAVGMLKIELTAAGRVYWLLRYMDCQGRGWLFVEDIREQLTSERSVLRICGWRRLRQILAQGDGIFWHQDGAGRLWLVGAAKLAASLEVGCFVGRPVEVPIKELLGDIKAVRAHFYACFHSGRRESNPISREVLRELTNVPERTQHEYEQLAGVKKRRNIAIGERYTQEEVEERSWRQGCATFHFVDFRGKRGQKGREYVAWHMPNAYEGPHSQCCKGRQKKINRELRDLVMKGMRGNTQEKVTRLFWAHGAAAGKAYGHNQKVDAYWPDGVPREHKPCLWHVMAAAGDGRF